MVAARTTVWFSLVALCAIARQRWPRGGVKAIDLILDAGMVENMQSANLTAKRFASTDFVDLTCKVDYSILDGPGAHLTNGFFLGDTVARETFVTRFVQDVSLAASVSTSRVMVLEIAPGRVHHDWEANSVIVLFRLVDNTLAGTTAEGGMVAAMASLTSQAQESGSALYDGRVTDRLDPSWGIVAVNLDVSLRLTTAIEVIGGNDVLEGYYLNQGAKRWCETGRSNGDTNIAESGYCQWESWFIADLSGALAPLSPERVRVLSVKRAAVDAVFVQFRLGEPFNYATEMTVDEAVTELLGQLRNASSSIFAGNVTVTVDPTWGVSGEGGTAREYSPHLPHEEYGSHLGDSYERCKDVHRCNRAWAHYNSTTREVHYTTQAFRDGLHVSANLFADFEDWQMGTFGWSMHGAPDIREADYSNHAHGVREAAPPRGAHFDPRNFSSLGPRVPVEVRGSREFSGLVLDTEQKDKELARLDKRSAQLRDKLAWIVDTRETALLDATRRSRHDAAIAADKLATGVRYELDDVLDTRRVFNSTQWLAFQACKVKNQTASEEGCGNNDYEWWAATNGSRAEGLGGDNITCPCTIVFNTSSLLFKGPFSATGKLALTEAGTEVAVWSFDQVYLGPEITIKVTGQRAMALLSRGSLVLNTSITAEPSTLGGFPGGGGIARDHGGADILLFPPFVPPAFPLSSLANDSLQTFDVPSYNINGPGSANYRYYVLTVTTWTDDDGAGEVQRICTSASGGQTLDGCFHLSWANLSTKCVPHDASPSYLQDIIEDGLNSKPVNRPGSLPRPPSRGCTIADGVRVIKDNPRESIASGVGRVSVTTDGIIDDERGRCWNVTFSSAVGAVGPMTLSARQGRGGSKLSGLGASATVETLRPGSAGSGNFYLRFAGENTEILPVTTSAESVSEALMELETVTFARTTRSLATAYRGDVLCSTEQRSGDGLEWTVEMATRLGNVEPTSPTVPVMRLGEGVSNVEEGAYDWPEAFSSLEGSGVVVTVRRGWASSADDLSVDFNTSRPFSIALGGAGASHGGIGGFGANQTSALGIPRNTYSSSSIPDLVGGSGGARTGSSPLTVNTGKTIEAMSSKSLLHGLGGAGGGAIELVALNDVTIGVMGSISVDGGDGEADWNSGGGGGSGGSVIIAAGGIVRHAGTISARGGDGGRTARPLSQNGGGGGAGGRVALYGQSVEFIGARVDGGSGRGVDVRGGSCLVTTKSGGLRDDACGEARKGGDGSFYVGPAFGYTLAVDDGNGLGGAGAEGTDSSLRLSRNEGVVPTSSDQPFWAFRPYDGPEYALRGDGATNKPDRATFYIKIAPADTTFSSSNAESWAEKDHASTTEWGAIFSLQGPGVNASSGYSERGGDAAASRDSSGLSAQSSRAWDSSKMAFLAPNTTLIGVAVVGGVMRHGSGFYFVPGDQGEETASGGVGGVLDGRVEGERWYKVDIMMRWEDDNSTAGEYDVLVDGIARAENQRFGGGQGSRGGIEKVGLYVLGRGRAWFDEVYLGPDFTMGFQCPKSSRRGVELRNAGRLKRREGLIDPGQSQNKIMQRHENFLSQREKYSVNNGGLVPFDGDGMRERLVDEYVRDYSDQPHVEGLRAGSLLMVPREEDFVTKRALHYGFAKNMDGDGLWSSDASGSPQAGGTRFWYGEHEAANDTQPWGRGLAKENDWTGGIGACSTDDFVDWKFEGIMLHYANVSDMVLGRKPEGGMILRQPKTLRLETAATYDNSSSSTYSSNGTTSSTLSNASGSFRDHTAFSAVDELYVMWMGAGESNGTFDMSAVATSHYPDGPFSMRRTFYPDGNETRDQTVYIGADGRGYLARTYYAEIEYVLPEAVMQPVWDSVKEKDGAVDFGLNYHRAFYSKDYDNYHSIYLQRWRMEDLPWRVACVDRITGESRDVPYGEFNEARGYCDQPAEYKVVLGQGYPVVSSRFKDPEDANNSFWLPESVPLVRAQSWAANYRDGLCGVRKMDEGFDFDDPALDTRSTMDRSNCSNIADNPIHDTLPDKLIGIQTVVETRLAKFVAVSRLTRDLLDTSAIMASFEGELEGQDDLMALITGNGYHRFDWSAGAEIRSTYHPQVFSDFKTAANLESLFRQYQASENDRAWYSLACQLDGTCPVNFVD